MSRLISLTSSLTHQAAVDALVDGHILLWESLYGVPVEALKQMEVRSGLNGMKMLHYLGCWDRWLAHSIQQPDCQEFRFSSAELNLEQFSFSQLLQEVHEARQTVLDRLLHLNAAEFGRAIPLLQQSIDIDEDFYRCFMPLDLNTEPGFTCTAREVVSYGLESARRGFLRRTLHLQSSSWLSCRTTEKWDLIDVIGHIADWEDFNTRAITAFRHTGIAEWNITKTGFNQWNIEHDEARKNQSWGDVLRDSVDAFRKLHAIARDWTLAELYERNPLAPSGWREYPFGWLTMAARHYREHFAMLDNESSELRSVDIVFVDSPDAPYLPELLALLTEQGLTTQIVPTLESALESTLGGVPRLYVLELGLPDGDGATFYEKVLAAKPATPLLVLTRLGYDRRHWLMRHLNRGHCRLLYKPAQPKKVLEVIVAMLDQVRIA